MFPWQVFGLHRLLPTHPDFPVAHASSVVLLLRVFRTCLPLRGSSGLSPDSLFALPQRSGHGMKSTIA